jgi:predicted AlkP superfamily pyrophosphatase or phosphodiesterase
MINPDSLQVTADLPFGQHFIRPAYGSYCFAHLPETVKRLFGLEGGQALPAAALPASSRFDSVILMLVDGFGWQLFERALAESAFLRQLVEDGVLSRLTSMFPSTTAAHVTCLNSGLPVAQSGVYEWFYYEPKVDQVIAPLLFSPAGEKMRELLAQQGARPEDLFPQPTLYHQLERGRVNACTLVPLEYAHSSYNRHISRGAEILPYRTWSEALTNLGLLLEQTTERLYVMLYFPNLDSIAHLYGPHAIHLEREIDSFLVILELFFQQLRSAARRRKTLLLLTADHGEAPTDPATTVYLNHLLPRLAEHFRLTRKGEPILFGGSPRDLFLYVKAERLPETQALLSSALAGLAEVHLTQDLHRAGFFGPGKLTDPLAGRLGNLVILPYHGQSVFWHIKDKFEQKFLGHHGGLSPQEMLIPLLVLQLS